MSNLKKELSDLIPAELKAKIKSVYAKFNTPAPVVQTAPVPPAAPVIPAAPAALTETTLQDGTVLKYDTPTLSQGSVVTIVSPEGEMPCPAGEHQLADGTKITVVSQEGKSVVEAVTPAQAPPAAPATQAAEPNHADQIAQISKIINGFESKFSSQENEKKELQKRLNEVEEKFSTLQKDVAAFMVLFNEIADTPSTAPIEAPKNLKGINKFTNRTIAK